MPRPSGVGQGCTPKRVVMIAWSRIFHDARIIKEAKSLAAHGYDCRIVGIGDHTHKTSIGDIEVSIVAIPEPSESRIRFVRILANTGNWISLNLAMARTARRVRPDVLHCHDLNGLLTGFVARGFSRTPLIYDAHELFTEQTPGQDWRKRLWSRFERFALPKVALTIAANKERAAIMHEEYGAHEVPLVIMNVPSKQDAAEPSAESLRAREATGAKRLIMYQGGLSSERGLEAVVEALPLLPPGIHAVFMGPGEPPTRLQALAEELGVSDRVHHWPAVPPDRVIQWAAAADAGVVSYLPDCRNNLLCAPNKLYDYLAGGTPVLAADLPPLRTAVEESGAGELFEPGDAASFADAARRLLGNDERLDAAREAARRHHEAETWEVQETRLIDAYSRLWFEQRIDR